MSELSEKLRRYIVTDPISHETGADPEREFRVNRIAALCQVQPDEVREWALGKFSPSNDQYKTLVSILESQGKA